MGRCCVKKCKEQGIHRIPHGTKMRKAWLDAINQPKLVEPDEAKICSKHFKKKDFTDPVIHNGIELKRLKNTAVPSLFLKPETASAKSRRERLEKPNPAIPFVGVATTEALHLGNKDKSKINVKLETNQLNDYCVKVEIEPSICRTCLTENAITPLSENCDDGSTLGTMLEKIAGVTMAEGLPGNICFVCTGDLQLAIAFRRRAQIADKTLHEKLNTTLIDDNITGKTKENVKREFPPRDMLDPNFTNIHPPLEKEDMVCKNEDEKAAEIDHDIASNCSNGSGDWEPSDETFLNKISVKKPLRKQKKKKEEKMKMKKNKKEEKMKIKKTKIPDIKATPLQNNTGSQQVVKLKAIDKNMIPLGQLKKIQLIKLNPNIQPKPGEVITNPTTKVATEISALEKPMRKRVKNAVEQLVINERKENPDKPIKNSVKTYNLLPNEPEPESENKGEFICPKPTCGRTFTSQKSLMQHKYVSHLPQNRLFLCLTCGKKSYSRTRALNHLQVHKKEENKIDPMKIQCELCGVFVRFECQLERHIKKAHKEERPHTCPDCDRRFFYLHSMLKHRSLCKGQKLSDIDEVDEPDEPKSPKQTVPEGLKPKKDKFCNICGRGFALRKTLVNHIRTHTGEKPFRCEHCDSSFAQRTAMLTHVKRIHLNIKPKTNKQKTILNEIQDLSTPSHEIQNLSNAPSEIQNLSNASSEIQNLSNVASQSAIVGNVPNVCNFGASYSGYPSVFYGYQ